MRNTLILSLLAIFLFSCKGSSSGAASAEQICPSFDGVWTTCGTDGQDSQLIELDILGTDLQQTISTYLGKTDCSGEADSSFTVPLEFLPGEAGASTFVAGGTDLDVTPPIGVDFGCGDATPIYLTAKFANNCSRFFTTENSCDSNARNTVLQADPFIKEE